MQFRNRYFYLCLFSLVVSLSVAAFRPFHYFGWYDEIYTVANMYFSGSWFNPSSYNRLFAGGSYLYESYPRVPFVIFLFGGLTNSKFVLPALMFFIRAFWYFLFFRQVSFAWSPDRRLRAKSIVILFACVVVLLFDIYNWGWFFNGFGSAIFLTTAQLYLLNKVFYSSSVSPSFISSTPFVNLPRLTYLSRPLLASCSILCLGFFTVGSQDYYVFYAFSLAIASTIFLFYFSSFHVRRWFSWNLVLWILPLVFVTLLLATSSSTLGAGLYARSIAFDFTSSLLDLQYIQDVLSGIRQDDLFPRFFVSMFSATSALLFVGELNLYRFSFVILCNVLPALLSAFVSALQLYVSFSLEDGIASRALLIRANACAHTDGMIISLYALAVTGYLVRAVIAPGFNATGPIPLLSSPACAWIFVCAKRLVFLLASALFVIAYASRLYKNYQNSVAYTDHFHHGFLASQSLSAKTDCRRIIVHYQSSYEAPYLADGFRIWLQSKPLNTIAKYTYLTKLVYRTDTPYVHPSNLFLSRPDYEVDKQFLRLAGVCSVVWSDGSYDYLPPLKNPYVVSRFVPLIQSSSFAESVFLMKRYRKELLNFMVVILDPVDGYPRHQISGVKNVPDKREVDAMFRTPLLADFSSPTPQPSSSGILFLEEMHPKYQGFCLTAFGWKRARLRSVNLVNTLATCSARYTKLKIFS
jgi:hypothetical protein